MKQGDKIIVKKPVGALKNGMHGICIVPPTEEFAGTGRFEGREIGINFDTCFVFNRVDSPYLPNTPNKYKRTVPSTTIDIYDILQAWQVTNPAIQHAIKKLLQPGQRGHKTRAEDLQEALVSIERAIELERV